MGRLVIDFAKNVKKFTWEMADEKNGGWYTGDNGLSKEQILQLIKICYTQRRMVYFGEKLILVYLATTPNAEEDLKKIGWNGWN